MSVKKRILLGLIFVGCIIILRLSGVGRYVTLGNIKENRDYLQLLVSGNYSYVMLGYILTYALCVTLLIPVAAPLTITGGFLFGTFLGAVYANIGATLGAIGAFLLVRYSFGAALQRKYAQQLVRFNRAMHEEGMSYLLSVHFIAVIPFFLVNILAGLTQVPLWTFIWTTSVGIFPGSLVYAFAGQQLNTIENVRDIFSLKLLLAFLLLAVLAALPILIKKYKKMRVRV